MAPLRMAINGGAGRATPLDAENDAKGGLADRMRALQSRASRLSTSS
jgi:hypothetical protein